jgi:hypothetical protein
MTHHWSSRACEPSVLPLAASSRTTSCWDWTGVLVDPTESVEELVDVNLEAAIPGVHHLSFGPASLLVSLMRHENRHATHEYARRCGTGSHWYYSRP